jgi:transcription elongation factor SPT5
MSDSDEASNASDDSFHGSEGGGDHDEEMESDHEVATSKHNKNKQHVLSDDDENDDDENDDDEHGLDELNDDYDSEEDEDYDDRPAKKKKKSAVSRFIVEEAEVDDDDEEDDEEAEEGYDEIVERDKGYVNDEGPSARDIEGRMRRKEMWDQKGEEEMVKYFKTKYGGEMSMAERYGEGEEMSDEITQQGLLPGVKDPNLWLVKCRMGEEKATAIALMRKFIAYQFSEQPLQIKSVIAKEGLRGYIYIEAFKQTHVKQIIEGVGSLRIGSWQQMMVPIKEMTDVLN